RARRPVLVVDEGHPRNAPAARAHGYLTRDGTPPLELLAAGRAEVAGYGGAIGAGARPPPPPAPPPRGPDAPAAKPAASAGRRGGCWSPPAWWTSIRTSPACGSGGAATSCTARSASAGSCATRRWASWPPASRQLLRR